MLIYNPTFDAKHCAYRFLSTLYLSNDESFAWDLFKLIDLYRLYPKLLLGMKPFPRELNSLKKKVSKLPDHYTIPQTPRKTLFQLQPIHNLVANWLIAKGFLVKDRFENGSVTRTDFPIPTDLVVTFEHDESLKADWVMSLVVDLPKSVFGGDTGIKKRTGYMEYRYDPR
ncbi:ABC-three component system middle component 5 [Maridesulfovibrio sp.]|uniref:ABC-three component system middle component 5 n=1 Tax=unclassified Maridesulfovibrio TaxID=2794999 RepID=UPI003B00A43B